MLAGKASPDIIYRAVDQHGQTIDFLLRRDCGIAAAQAFFRKALDSNGDRFPRTVTLDGHVPSRSALWKLRPDRVKGGSKLGTVH